MSSEGKVWFFWLITSCKEKCKSNWDIYILDSHKIEIKLWGFDGQVPSCSFRGSLSISKVWWTSNHNTHYNICMSIHTIGRRGRLVYVLDLVFGAYINNYNSYTTINRFVDFQAGKWRSFHQMWRGGFRGRDGWFVDRLLVILLIY